MKRRITVECYECGRTLSEDWEIFDPVAPLKEIGCSCYDCETQTLTYTILHPWEENKNE